MLENFIVGKEFYAGVEYKGKIIFSAWETNALCSMDIKSGKTSFIRFFENEEMIPRLHHRVYIHSNEAWFVPHSARNIVCVNLDTYEETFFPVSFKKERKYTWDGSYFAVYYGIRKSEDCLLLLPGCIDSMAVVDMKNHSVHWIYDFIKIDGTNQEDALLCGCMYKSQILLFHNSKSDHFFSFDVETETICKHMLPAELLVTDEPFQIGENILFVPDGGDKISYFNIEKGEVGQINTGISGNSHEGYLEFSDSYLLLPFLSDYFLIVSKSDMSVRKYIMEETFIYKKGLSSMMSIPSDSYKMLTTGGSNAIIVFDNIHNGKVIPIDDSEIKKDFVEALIEDRTKKRKFFEYYENILSEDNIFSLKWYLKNIQNE